MSCDGHLDRGSGDLPFQTMRDSIESKLLANTNGGVTFYPARHGETLDDENFSYRRMFVPYLRQEHGSDHVAVTRTRVTPEGDTRVTPEGDTRVLPD